jgi:D-alanyl-D-alanine dipeptidase
MAEAAETDVPGGLWLPERGFLLNELSSQQRGELNRILSSGYAAAVAGKQAELLRIPIVESREKMVDLLKVLDQRGLRNSHSTEPIPIPSQCIPSSGRVFRLRESVAEKVANMVKNLRSVNAYLHVEDCYRSPEVQKGLFFRRVVSLARSFPDVTSDEVWKMALSLTAGAPGLAGHMSGAALDAVPRDMHNNMFKNTGSRYPDGGATSSLLFPYLTFSQWYARACFVCAALLAKLKLLFSETWHVSDGDRGMVPALAGSPEPARFGPLQGFDPDSGMIIPFEANTIDQYFMTPEQVEQLVVVSRSTIFGLDDLYEAYVHDYHS